MKIRLALSILAFFGQFFPFVSGPVGASTVHVGPGGNCGIESPCSETIQYALDLSDAEVSLEICQGTYIENLAFPADSTFRKRTLRCQGNITVDGDLTIRNGMLELQSGAFVLQDQDLTAVTVPDVVGKDKTIAEGDIVAVNLAMGQQANRGSDTVPVDHVISQVPAAGVSMAPGNLVDLTVSSGTGGTMEVPFVVGKTKADAYDEISEANLYTGTITEQYSDTTPAGQVVNQSPLGGITVDWDVPVDLLISLGPSGNPTPDPADVAPEIDMTVPTAMIAANEFLYTGTDPVQKGVMPGAIEDNRICVIRGKALESNGDPLSEVKVTVLNRKEYGCTHTRDDGMFDLAVNGGEYLAVSFEKEGFLPSHRRIETLWQNFVRTPDVVLISLDPNVSAIDFSAPGMQVAQGSPVADDNGSRQATLLFPEGTEATLQMPDGTEQSVATLNVRATEYTVGPEGPMAMPAELPPASGYTYAVDFTTDEAIAAGAVHVNFNQQVVGYVENFLDFPTGGAVPVGVYDWQMGRWTPQNDGRIIEILGQTGAMADLDVDGDGVADTGSTLSDLGITDAERERLASLYTVGQSLWRVPIYRFTWPYDMNWPYGPAGGGGAPPPDEPSSQDRQEDNPCEEHGQSRIEIQNQVLTETVDVAGTPFTLNYRSDRVPGRTASGRLKIVVTGNDVPPTLKRIELQVEICGRRFREEFLPPFSPNTTNDFAWDGLDPYGRKVQGKQEATVKIGYIYDAVYMEPAEIENYSKSFDRLSSSGVVIGGGYNFETAFLREWRTDLREPSVGSLGVFETLGQGLGGWTISVKHDYDPASRTLYRGDGGRRVVAARDRVIETRAGNGSPEVLFEPKDVAAGPDGSLFVSDQGNQRIRMVSPDGTITTIAGTGTKGYNGDSEALGTKLNNPTGLAPGPGGSYEVTYAGEPGNPPTVTRVWHPLLYFADQGNHRVRKLTRYGEDLYVGTAAGSGTQGYLVPNLGGDGIPATYARLNNPSDVALDPEGSLYIADQGNHRIRKVTPDGMIYTVAGDGTAGYNGDDIPAAQARLKSPRAVSVGSDGCLYIADMGNHRVRKVSTDGIITTVAGTGTEGFFGDGGLATDAWLKNPLDVLAATDGSLYISDSGNHRIRQVLPNGTIVTAVGTTMGFGGDGGPAAACQMQYPQGLSFSPEEKILIVDSQSHRVREAWYPQEDFLKELLIASADGGSVFVFSPGGRHLQTLHALTGEVLYSFSYDSEGRLIAVTDAYDNVTTIERDASGDPTAIVAPFGQRTTLGLDANGYLASVANPAGETHSFTYHGEGGLLATHTDPRNNTSEFTYDALGRLTLDEDPVGGYRALERTEDADGYEVETSTAEGATSTYRVEHLQDGSVRMENSLCSSCGSVELLTKTDGTRTTSLSDGTVFTVEVGPDPRWGMQAPLAISTSIDTPGGLTSVQTMTRSVDLADPDDIFSLETLTDTVAINNRTYAKVFDGSAMQWILTSPEGRQSMITMNEHGRVVESQVPGLNPLQFTYNAQGKLTQVSQGSGPDSRIGSISYGADGYAESTTDPISRTIVFERDPAGRVTKKTYHDGREVQASFNANGQLTSLTPPGRPSHTFDHTPVGLLSLYDQPDVGAGTDTTEFVYNLDRDIEQENRPDGKALEYQYDDGGRVEDVTVAGGQYVFAYDPATGNLTGITSPGGESLGYAYDDNLLTGTTWTGTITGVVTRDYNNDFQISERSVNGSYTVQRSYDNDGLLTLAGALQLGRNPNNGLLTTTTLNDVTDNIEYNDFAEMNSYQVAYGGSNFFEAQYTLDKVGQITDKAETVDAATSNLHYEYDLAGRLVEVHRDGVLEVGYTYDANGNRSSRTDSGGTVDAVYDNQDRMSRYGDNIYTYTANGELLSKTAGTQTTEYEYDEAGNLMNVTMPDSTRIDYVVDGRNRRIGKKVDGVLATGWLYSNRLNIIAELNADGSVKSRFVYASKRNVPDYMERDGNTYRIVSDHLGSPRFVIDSSTGAEAQRMDYDEFGNVVLDTNQGFQPFGFAGGLYDPDTRLTRFGVRDYDAETGRWTAKDPVLFAGGNTNLYAYALDDPVNRIDPSGGRPTFMRGDNNQLFEIEYGKNGESYVKETQQTEKGTYEREDAYNPKTGEVVTSSSEIESTGRLPEDAGGWGKGGSPVRKAYENWGNPEPPVKPDTGPKPKDKASDENQKSIEDLPEGPDFDKNINDEDPDRYNPC